MTLKSLPLTTRVRHRFAHLTHHLTVVTLVLGLVLSLGVGALGTISADAASTPGPTDAELSADLVQTGRLADGLHSPARDLDDLGIAMAFIESELGHDDHDHGVAALASPAAEPVATAASVAAVPASSTVSAPSGALVVWPHNGPLTGWWGEARRSHRHSGIDIDGNSGDPLRAAGSGVVVAAGYQTNYQGYGQIVAVDHGGGLTSFYAHLDRVDVAVGQSLAAGQHIGTMGTTGNVTGSHLHFEVFVGGARVNPMDHLPAR